MSFILQLYQIEASDFMRPKILHLLLQYLCNMIFRFYNEIKSNILTFPFEISYAKLHAPKFSGELVCEMNGEQENRWHGRAINFWLVM